MECASTNARESKFVYRRAIKWGCATIGLAIVLCLLPIVAALRQYQINQFYERTLDYKYLQYNDPSFVHQSASGVYRWLGLTSIDRLIERCSKPVLLWCEGPTVDGEMMDRLAEWSDRWEMLIFRYSSFDDECAVRIRQMPHLQLLTLTDTDITGQSLATLAGHTSLALLGISGTAITDADLNYLRTLPNLRILSVADTPITPNGLQTIAELSGLESLCLVGCTALPADPRIFLPFRGHRTLKLVFLDERFDEPIASKVREVLPGVEVEIESPPTVDNVPQLDPNEALQGF